MTVPAAIKFLFVFIIFFPRLQDKFAHTHNDRNLSEIVGKWNGPSARLNLFLLESERKSEGRLKGEYRCSQQAGRLMEVSEVQRCSVWLCTCFIQKWRLLQACGRALIDRKSVPSFLSVFPTVDFNRCGMQHCIVGGRKETVQWISAAGWLARRSRIVLAPVGAEVVRESNTMQRAETGSVHVHKPAWRLSFPFDRSGIQQPCKAVESPQFMGDLARVVGLIWMFRSNSVTKTK